MYCQLDSPAPGSSQNSREIHFLRPQSDGRADIHLLVVIFVMNELWVAETQGRGVFFLHGYLHFFITLSIWHCLLLVPKPGLLAGRADGNPSLANSDFIYQKSNEQFLSPCSLSTFQELDFLRSIYYASHSRHISLSFYQGLSLSVDLKMVKGDKKWIVCKAWIFPDPFLSNIKSGISMSRK